MKHISPDKRLTKPKAFFINPFLRFPPLILLNILFHDKAPQESFPRLTRTVDWSAMLLRITCKASTQKQMGFVSVLVSVRSILFLAFNGYLDHRSQLEW
jgi:hypothetical protein